MIITLGTLDRRTTFIEDASHYFSERGITSSIILDFKSNIMEGTKIMRILIERYSMDEILINKLDHHLLRKIEDYLIVSECLFSTAGICVDSEYCRTREVSLDFLDIRLYLMKYLKGELKSPYVL